jgi:hypothetical protein
VSAAEAEIRRQARREAAPAAAVPLALLVLLAIVSRIEGWEMLSWVRWWVWLVVAVPVLLLIADLVLGLRVAAVVRTRGAALTLLAILVSANLAALAILIGGLVTTSTRELGGAELLLTAFVIWATDVSVFGIWFWELDDGGPVARATTRERSAPDLQFPQDENPALAAAGWRPDVWDYVYVSLTNSIAFSPTDAMPLSRRAKGLMALEAMISAVTVLLVAARAVNVLGT